MCNGRPAGCDRLARNALRASKGSSRRPGCGSTGQGARAAGMVQILNQAARLAGLTDSDSDDGMGGDGGMPASEGWRSAGDQSPMPASPADGPAALPAPAAVPAAPPAMPQVHTCTFTSFTVHTCVYIHIHTHTLDTYIILCKYKQIQADTYTYGHEPFHSCQHISHI